MSNLKDQFDNFLKSSEQKSISHHDLTWNYFVTGNSNRTLLVLTGGGSIAEAAFIYVNSLSASHRVITLTVPEANTVAECLDGIKAILEAENTQQISLLGFSMGGMLAQCFVRTYPDMVDNLILFVSMPPSKDYARKYRKYKGGIAIVPEFLFKWISKRSLRKQVLADSAGATEEDISFWVEFFNWEFDSGKMNKQLLLATSNVLIDYFQNYQFSSADLDDWKGKILLIESDHDQVVSETERQRFKSLYPQATLITQAGSGHFGAGLLKPEGIIASIRKFLN